MLALSACSLQAQAVLSSERDFCVHSINMNFGTIVYFDESHLKQDIQYFDGINTEAVMVILALTLPSTDDVEGTRVYQVSKTRLCYYVSPQLLDLMSFYSLKL